MSKIRVCRRCHTAVIPTKTPGYAFACPEHDEDLYDFETELVDTKTKKGLTMTRAEKKLIRDYVEIEYEHSNGRNVRIQADGSVTGQVDATPNTNHQAGRIVAGKDTDILRGAKIYTGWGYENHLRSKNTPLKSRLGFGSPSMEPTANDNQPVGNQVPGQHQEIIMSTPCAIGMKMADGSVKAFRCNFDGYTAGAGAILAGWYTQQEDVEKLLERGDLSELGDTIDDCVAYHRDRGEKLNPAVEFNSAEDFRRTGKAKMCADFLYLFEDGQWSTFGLRNINEWIKLNVITGQCENSKG